MRSAAPEELAALLAATPLVIMLDIDGTLCDIVERPENAAVPEMARRALRTLIAARKNGVYVALVTGRSVADARRMVGIDGVAIYGNHGIERLSADGNISGAAGSEEAARGLRDAAAGLARIVARFPGTSLEDKHFSLTLHFRGMNTALVPDLNSRISELAEHYSLRLSPGKCVINVLPAVSATKGDAVNEIIADAIGDAASASILFVGDDVTDEDAFRELAARPNAVTVRVGDADTQSSAKFALPDPGAVHRLLSLLAESRA